MIAQEPKLVSTCGRRLGVLGCGFRPGEGRSSFTRTWLVSVHKYRRGATLAGLLCLFAIRVVQDPPDHFSRDRGLAGLRFLGGLQELILREGFRSTFLFVPSPLCCASCCSSSSSGGGVTVLQFFLTGFVLVSLLDPVRETLGEVQYLKPYRVQFLESVISEYSFSGHCLAVDKHPHALTYNIRNRKRNVIMI